MKHGWRCYDDAMLMMWMVRQRWTGARDDDDDDDDDDGTTVMFVVIVVRMVVVVVALALKKRGFKLSVGAPGP